MTKQLRLTLETVTPLFLGGSEPRGKPELRPSSVKGALRFWWRALWGGVHPNASPHQLLKAESAVFGNTEQAAPVVMRLAGELPELHRGTFSRNQAGLGYLFFTFRKTGQDPARSGFDAGQTFELILSPRVGLPKEQVDEVWKQSCAALWLWTRFGALGARSRRGAGALQVVEASEWPEELPSPIVRATQATDFIAECQSGLAQLSDGLGWPRPDGELNGIPEYDILHPRGAAVYVLAKPWPTWEAALDELGNAYKLFRGRQGDARQVKQAVAGQSNRIDPVSRAALGLPIVFYYRDLPGKTGTLEGETADRRASPLSFRVVKLANGAHIVLLLHFHSRFLPDGTGLKLDRRGPDVITRPPDGSIIPGFIRAIRDNQNEAFVAPWRSIRLPRQEDSQ